MRPLPILLLLLPALVTAAATAPQPSPQPSPAPAWTWPVAGTREVIRPYLAPATEYGAGHRGVDVAAPDPGTVTAPAAGVVHFAGTVVDRPVLSIDHGGGVLSSFEPVTTTLAVGDTVETGQEIGTVEPGHCAVQCLHLGARVNGSYVSPLLFLGGGERSRLLPTRPIASGS